MLIIPTCERLRQGDCEFKASLTTQKRQRKREIETEIHTKKHRERKCMH